MEKNAPHSEQVGSVKTPYLEIRLDKIRDAYARLSKYLNGIEIYYAMKANPNLEIMKAVLDCGGSFEISSAFEMFKALEVGEHSDKILFSNPIKTFEDIRTAYDAGVKYFAFDSISEVDKLAEAAPGSNVYVRLTIPVRKSTVASEGKFGVSIEQALDLMLYAKNKGLNPYGVSFHVGSQMLDNNSWGYAIQYSSKLFNLLRKKGIYLEFLDMGGGFPVCYEDVRRDDLDEISKNILKAIKKYMPHGIRVIAEPGRYMVAESGIMVSTVIGTADRSGKKWLHLDVGANNGMMEAVQTSNELLYPVHDSKKSTEKEIFTLTGPTCDSQDTILFDVPMSHDIKIGDKVYFEFAGAYTTAMTENFNGFPDPTTYIISE